MGRRVVRILALLACGVAIGWRVHRPAPNAPTSATAALQRTVPVIRFKDAPLDRVIHEFERTAGVPIEVNWAALAEAGVSPDSRVSLHRYNSSFGNALRRIADQLSSDARLTFEDECDRIVLDLADTSGRRSVVRGYDVADVLHGNVLDELMPPVALLGPTRRVAIVMRDRRRVRRGWCAACGYDLRGGGGAGRCPECGEATAPTSPPAPPSPPPAAEPAPPGRD